MPKLRIHLIFVFILVMLPSASAYQLQDRDVVVSTEGVILSCSYNFITGATIIEIPEKLNNTTITGIAAGVFNVGRITSVTLPETLKWIGANAFKGNNLTSISIPNSVSQIDEGAFAENEIVAITLGNGIKTWGTKTFSDNRIANLVIPEGIESIGTAAFQNNRIKTVTFPSTLKTIHANAFYGGSNQLITLIFPEGLVEIGDYAFYGNALTSVNLPQTVKQLGVSCFAKNQIVTVSLSSGTESINVAAFANNVIKQLTIPEGIKRIENSAFGQNIIATLNLPVSLEYVGEAAFSNNELSTLELSENVKVIGSYAFNENKITSISFPNQLTSIGKSAFEKNRIAEITFPNSITYIGDYAFSENLITNFVLPEDLTEITRGVFYANRLKTLVLPERITSIGDYAFSRNQISDLVVTSGVLTIGRSAFSNNQMQSLTLNENLKEIGDSAFARNKLAEITLPNQISDMGNYAFAYNSIQDISLPTSISSISIGLFSYNKLTEITFPNNIQIIKAFAFEHNAISDLFIPDTLTNIRTGAFQYNKIKTLRLSPKTISIASLCFSNNALKEINLPDSLIEIEDMAFFTNEDLETINFNSEILRIKPYAFQYCNLSKVNIPTSLVMMGEFAFDQNMNLSTINLPVNPNGDTWIDTKGAQHKTGTSISDFKLSYILEVEHTLTATDLVLNDEGFIIACNYNSTYGIASVLTIPEKIEGKTIVGIADGESYNSYYTMGIFSYRNLLSVNLPDSMHTIGNYAFANNYIYAIQFPDSIEYINSYAFLNNKLQQIQFTEGGKLFRLGLEAFRDNYLPNFTLPKSEIEGHEYGGWRDGNKNIYRNNLNVNNFNVSYETLLKYTLRNQDVVVENGVIISCSYDFKAKIIAIPDTLDGQTIIGIDNYVFSGKGIVEVQLPGQLININQNAFSSNDLITLDLPSSVKIIGNEAFIYNDIDSLFFHEDSQLSEIGSYAFRENKINGTVYIPESVRIIRDYAFYNNSIDSLVILPTNNLTHLGDYAFAQNSIYNEITIPKGVVQISTGLFYLNRLSKVNLHNKIIDIEAYAFYGNKFNLSITPLHEPPTIPYITWFIHWKDNNGNFYDPGHIITNFQTYYKAEIDQYIRVEFLVKDDNGVPLDSAIIQFSDSLMITNIDGIDSIAPVIRGIHQYTVSAEGCQTFKSYVDVQDDQYIKIVLIRNYAVDIGIENIHGDAITNAEVALVNVTLFTDSLGHIYTQKPDGSHHTVISANGYGILDTSFLVLDQDTTYTFQLAPSVITYWPNRADGNLVTDTAKAIEYNPIANPFTREHYVYSHWNTDADNIGDSYTHGTKQTLPPGDFDLFAIWTPFPYSIIYDLKGGQNNAINPDNYTIESPGITLQPATKTGMYFATWFDNDSNRVKSIDAGSSGNVYLWAWFTPEPTYFINYYNVENATHTNPDLYTRFDLPLTFSDAKFRGYEFLGWYDDSFFSKSRSGILAGSQAELNLYARWGNPIEYPITYILQSGLNDAENPTTYNINDSVYFQPATRPGYTFKGWYIDSLYTSGIQKIDTGNIGDTTLFAAWKLDTFNITYETYGGINDGRNPAMFTYESKSILLEEAQKDSSQFMGWFTEPEFVNQVDSIPQNSTGDLKLYARWFYVFDLNFVVSTDGLTPAKDVSVILNDTDTLKTDAKGNAKLTLFDNSHYTYRFEVDDVLSSSGEGIINFADDTIETKIVDAYMRWYDVIFCDNGKGLWTSFQWFRNQSLISNEQFYHQPGGISSGTYSLVVTSQDGKEYTWTQTYNQNNFVMKVFPNPSRQAGKIQLVVNKDSDFTNLSIRVYNIVGELVSHQKITGEVNIIDAAGQLPTGNYQIMLIQQNKVLTTQHLIIQ